MQQLFTSCVMSIPEYQRAYVWEPPQWEDLWDDVCEGLLNRTDHFLGTVVLRQSEEHRTDMLGRVVEVFDVVDGQQRLTTLVLLVLALFEHLREQPLGKGMWLDFVAHDGIVRLELGGVNTQYFLSLIDAVRDSGPLPDSPRATNRRMRGGLSFFREKLKAFSELPTAPRPQDFVTFIRDRLHTLRFVTDDAALAIKTFQTINDRGRPLTLLDKTKSLLMFYVTKYLDGDGETLRGVWRRSLRSFVHVGPYLKAMRRRSQRRMARIPQVSALESICVTTLSNKGLQATASSLRSCLAPASGRG
jgi:hypothetical protein